MAGTEEGDGFSDDELDALGSEDFLQLQNQAIQSTQHIRNEASNQQWLTDPSGLAKPAQAPERPYTVPTHNDLYQPDLSHYRNYGQARDERHHQTPKERSRGKQAPRSVANGLRDHVEPQQWPASRTDRPRQALLRHHDHPSSINTTLPHRGPASSPLNELTTEQRSSTLQPGSAPANNAESVALQRFQAELEQVQMSSHSA